MFDDIKIVKSSKFKDKRGVLWTTWKKGIFKKIRFNHDKFSLSKKNTLRGLHCDFKSWKMITCVYGKFLLVAVDMRKNSKTFLKWDAVVLSEKKKNALYVPPNCAHGYMTLEKNSNLIYLIDNYFDKKTTRMFYKDETLKIKWPKIKKITIAESDQNAPSLKDLNF